MSRNESRSAERIREHYLLEKELAERLKKAGPQERPRLYSAVYDELFRRLPDHPLLAQKADPQAAQAAVSERLALLRPYLHAASTFLEIGPGDCSLARAVAAQVRKVYAVEASQEISRVPSDSAPAENSRHSEAAAMPENLQLIVSGSGNVPGADGSVDVAYSDQLLEHLHPDDALTHLQNIYQALAPSGIYICITPNRLSGPHDISRDFDDVATGLHLKEYTAAELAGFFRAAGFARMKLLVGARGRHLAVPVPIVAAIESFLAALPRSLVKPLARSLPLRVLLGVKLLAQKPAAPAVR